ncbi:MAG: menaquinone biosynthesis protein [Candidatus Sumerlaeota bacterium]|nr:menaquinone biosynthesis protein [Candidatus Sumerlaeota bacterium]
MSHDDLFSSIPPLRLGVVPYLNVQPLVYGLAEACPQLQLTPAPPSQLQRMLVAGEADLGTAPTFCAFANEGLGILPAPAIASDGDVFSVLVVAREPLASLRRVWRDPHSVTSNALTAILIQRRWGGRIEMANPPAGVSLDPRELPAATGRVLIGDPALRFRSRYSEIIDLGRAWREWTGLPFVFAAWIGPVGTRTGSLAEALRRLRRTNAERLEEVAAAYDGLPDVSVAERARYLRENLSFRFGARERQAIERFHAESKALGLFNESAKLRWIG